MCKETVQKQWTVPCQQKGRIQVSVRAVQPTISSLPPFRNFFCKVQRGFYPDYFKCRCICVEGTSGKLCHIKQSPCKKNLCKNGGTCVPKPTGGFRYEEFKIISCCALCWHLSKPKCKQIKPVCAQSTFHLSLFFTSSCVCKQGITGKLCEKKVNPCTKKPCKNKGRCVPDKKGGYK